MTKDSSKRRIIRNFNHDWLFIKADDLSFSEPGLDDSAWRRLNLPHDFSIETVPDEKNKTGSGGGYTGAGCGWYRKHFEYDPSFDGRAVLEEKAETTGEPVRLIAKADREIVRTGEVVHIELSTLDLEGRDVPTASPYVECEIVSGPAHLIGMDAGDMHDLSLYSRPGRRMHSGRLMAMIMADAPGEVQVRFSADGIEPVTVSFTGACEIDGYGC